MRRFLARRGGEQPDHETADSERADYSRHQSLIDHGGTPPDDNNCFDNLGQAGNTVTSEVLKYRQNPSSKSYIPEWIDHVGTTETVQNPDYNYGAPPGPTRSNFKDFRDAPAIVYDNSPQSPPRDGSSHYKTEPGSTSCTTPKYEQVPRSQISSNYSPARKPVPIRRPDNEASIQYGSNRGYQAFDHQQNSSSSIPRDYDEDGDGSPPVAFPTMYNSGLPPETSGTTFSARFQERKGPRNLETSGLTRQRNPQSFSYGSPYQEDNEISDYPHYGNNDLGPPLNQSGNLGPPSRIYEEPSDSKTQYQNSFQFPIHESNSSSSLYSPAREGTSTVHTVLRFQTPEQKETQLDLPKGEKKFVSPTRKPVPSSILDTSPSRPNDNPNASKWTVRVFCQRQREDGDTREQLPRDIREFKVVSLSLMKLAAGEQRFVLLDVVFGEVDKLLFEKQWNVTLDTTVVDYRGPGSRSSSFDRVKKISPLVVAYKGSTSSIYIKFKNEQEEYMFMVELGFAMNTLRRN